MVVKGVRTGEREAEEKEVEAKGKRRGERERDQERSIGDIRGGKAGGGKSREGGEAEESGFESPRITE